MCAAPRTRLQDLLDNRNFWLFWGARVCSIMGFQVLAVVVGWQVYSLTHQAFYLGMVGLVQFLPILLFVLPAGQLADRVNRRLIFRTCQLVAGVSAAAMALGWASGMASLPWIFAAVAISGACRAFENPAGASLLPNLVPRENLPRALATVTSGVQTATIVGPALGGVLCALGVVTAYTTIAGLALAAAACSSLIAYRPAARAKAAGVGVEGVFSGLRFILQRPMIFGAISLDMFAVLLGGATALLPAYAQDILHVGPWGLGMLRAAPAAGALSVSLLLARYPLRRRAGPTMFAMVALFGVATIGFGLSTWFPLSLALLAVMGGADVVSVVVRSSLVQLATPDAMRGRVSAVNYLFIGTSNQLGEFESGMVAAWLGTVPAVVVGGLGTLAVVALWIWRFPALRRVDDLRAVGVEKAAG
jgi:MFS family permease